MSILDIVGNNIVVSTENKTTRTLTFLLFDIFLSLLVDGFFFRSPSVASKETTEEVIESTVSTITAIFIITFRSILA